MVPGRAVLKRQGKEGDVDDEEGMGKELEGEPMRAESVWKTSPMRKPATPMEAP